MAVVTFEVACIVHSGLVLATCTVEHLRLPGGAGRVTHWPRLPFVLPWQPTQS